MRSRVQIAGLVVGLVVLALGLSLWRYASLEATQSENMISTEVERQAAAARQLVHLANTSLQERLIDLVSREQTGRQLGLSPATEGALNGALNASPYQAVALMKFDGRWQTSWVRARPSLAARWTDTFSKGVLQDLPIEGAKNSAVTWFRVNDPGQQPVFLILSQLKEGNDAVVAVGFLPVTAMNQVSEGFVGMGTELTVIDERGVAVAFTEQSYVGASLAEAYPPVGEVLRRREVSGKIASLNRARTPIMAASHKVDGSNLYVIAALPKETPWALLPRLIFVTLIFAIALCGLGAFLAVRLVTPLEKAISYLSAQMLNIAQGQMVTFFNRGNRHLEPLRDVIDKLVSHGPIEAPVQQVETQKLGAYKELTSGLADALRDPLAAVLAQAQLARGKSGHDEFKEHFVIIERETRRARDTIENLLRLSGEERFPRAKIDLQEPVNNAVNELKGLLNSHDVKVSKDLGPSTPVMANVAQLQTAVEELIKNSVESMQKNTDRLLRIATHTSDSVVSLTIEDNGQGIEKGRLGKVFDPFYTSKDSQQHKGLGLTVVKGIVRALNGNLKVDSAGPGAGTKVTLEIPTAAASANAKSGATKTESLRLDLPGTADLKAPLNGTAVDELPTAPALDELTLTGVRDGTDGFVAEQISDPDEVLVRTPKIKEPGT